MPDVPPIPPCLSERSQTDLLATATGLLNDGFGAAAATHALVSVAGANVSLRPAGTYQSLFIKNVGAAVLRVRFSSATASTTGANGEIPLAAESAPGAGDGGSISVSNVIGPVSAASPTSTSAAIVYS